MVDSLQTQPTGGRREFILVLGVAVSLTLTLIARTDLLIASHPVFSQPADHHKYIHMAEEGVLGFHIAPFCWRVAVPVIAGLFGGGAGAFLMLAALGIAGTGVAMFYAAKALGIASPLALCGMLLFFATGWAARFPLHAFWLPDAMAFLLLTAALVAILRGQDWAFALLLAVGVLVKENVLLAAPLYLTMAGLGRATPMKPARRVLRWLGLIAPAIIVFLLVRWGIAAQNDDPAYVASLPTLLSTVHNGGVMHHWDRLLGTIGRQRLMGLSWHTLHAWFVEPFGVAAMFLVVIGAWRRRGLLLRLSPLLLLAYAQLLVATDTQRLLVAAMPAVVLLSVCGLEGLGTWLRLSPAWWVLLPVSLLGLNLVYADRVSAPTCEQAVVLGACLLIVGIAGAISRRAAMERAEP